ncbi:RNA polymerase sigma factor [Streptomyces sp. NPDC048172]|uniref:RNA polymerase sigma factor n=1 Tax=Streptomyces sp. NPDC048172 TaxID=3365505 RepID=UPI00371AA521
MNHAPAEESGRRRASCDERRNKAWSDFYEQQQPKLRKFVARRIGGDEAHDVCQETWRTFFRWCDLRQPELNTSLGAFLFHIARLRIADFCQQRKRQPPPMAGEDLGALADSMKSRRDEFQMVDCRVDLRRALSCLTFRQREALHLQYVDGLRLGEAAVLMGISLGGVKNLRKRALIKLRSAPALASYGPTAPVKFRKVAN